MYNFSIYQNSKTDELIFAVYKGIQNKEFITYLSNFNENVRNIRDRFVNTTYKFLDSDDSNQNFYRYYFINLKKNFSSLDPKPHLENESFKEFIEKSLEDDEIEEVYQFLAEPLNNGKDFSTSEIIHWHLFGENMKEFFAEYKFIFFK